MYRAVNVSLESLPLLVAALRDSEVQMSTWMKIFLVLSMTTIIVITMTTMMVLVLMKTTTMTMRLVNSEYQLIMRALAPAGCLLHSYRGDKKSV